MASTKKITEEEFLKRAYAKFGDKFGYFLTIFKNNFTPVNIPMYKNLHTDILISHLIETTPEVPSVCYKFFKSPQ